MNDNHINYVELKANDLERVKEFYNQAFGWKFIDYGPTLHLPKAVWMEDHDLLI